MSPNARFLSFVVLSENAEIDGRALAGTVNGLSGATGVCTAVADGTDTILTVGETLVTVMNIAAPLPPDTLEEAIARARGWSGARRAVAGHKGHVVVASGTESQTLDDVRRDAAAVTLVCAALCRIAPVAAVNWTEAQTILPPGPVLDEVEHFARERWPLGIWINTLPFGRQRDAAGRPLIGMLTKGLSAFVGREIEFMPVARPFEYILERTVSFSGYLLSSGVTLADGETVGVSETEAIRVRHSELTGTGLRTFQLAIERAKAA